MKTRVPKQVPKVPTIILRCTGLMVNQPQDK